MALDTNVKKFKFSLPCRILCVFLCIVTFAGAVICGCSAFFSAVYFVENEDIESWTDTNSFYFGIYYDADEALRGATYSNRVAELQKIIDGKKENIIEKFVSLYIEEYNRQAADGVDYIDMSSFLDRNMPIYIPVNLYSFWGVYFNPVIPSNTMPHKIREVSENEFDDKNNFNYEQRDYHYSSDNDTGFLYYIDYGSKVYGDKTVPDKLDSSEIFYSLEGGKVLTKGISTELQNEIAAHISDLGIADKSEITFKFCLELEKSDSSLDTIWKTQNKYFQLKEFHALAQKVYSSIVIYAVGALVLLIASFVCGITFLKSTGRKGEGEKAKLGFIDYIPLELHLTLGVSVAVGAWWLTDMIVNYIDVFSVTFLWFITALVLLSQMLLLEFSSSVSRAIGSNRANKKFFLVFWVVVGLLGIFKLIKRTFKRMSERIKNAFKPFVYKSKHFDKLFIVRIVLFYIINIIMIGLPLYLASEWWLSSTGILFFVIVDIVVNFFMVRKAVSYVRDFDKIIVASGEKHEPDLVIDNLHLSLKTLAENMRYSNAELQTAIARAVKDERLRAELITNVSHDLKTPLTSIISYVDLLLKCDINDPKAIEYIKVLDEKGAKLKRLIDDLIEASKVTSGNVSIEITQLNLSELCLQSTTEAIPDFEKNSLELIVKQGEKPIFVLADGAKTYRVIENLLSNARKYSARHSRVYVSVYEEYGRGVLEIKNISATPLDITPDELTERFVRGDRSRNTDGNGLGLSIAKELCKAQSGELELTIDGDLFKARVILPVR